MGPRSHKTGEELNEIKRRNGLRAIPATLSEQDAAAGYIETFPSVNGGHITFGVKDGHVSYPDFGLSDTPDIHGSRNQTHDSIIEWLNGSHKFDNYTEQQILSRLMYLTNYGIVYPIPMLYSAMNAVLLHDKEKTLAYSSRWNFYEEFINLNVHSTTGYSLDDLLDKSRYESTKIFEMCRRKISRVGNAINDLKDDLDNLDK